MKLSHPYYFPVLQINDTEPAMLVIENNSNFRKVVSELITQINTGEGDFVLSEDSNILKLQKEAVFITDVFRLNFENRQLKGKLLQSLQKEAQEENYSDLMQKLFSLGSELAYSSKYPINFNMDLTITDVLKFLDFYIDIDDLSMVEKIVQYMSVCCDLLGIHLVILLNALDVMSKEEYLEFSKEIEYQHIPLLMIEHRDHDFVDHLKQKVIIDEDLCIL